MKSIVTIVLLLVYAEFVISSPVTDLLKTNTENNETARIVNGFEVEITEVPYQASLRRKGMSGWAHVCGAVVISIQGVLTAGHCVDAYESQPSLLRIIVGTSNRLSGGKNFDISNVYLHEEYSSITLNNDIALLATSKKISFSQSVSPITIAPENFYLPVGTEALVSGFGTTSYEGSSSSVLLATHVYITSQESCSQAYLHSAAILPGMVCANASNPARDACQGDSGGPLVALNHLVGIVSWGEGCASLVYPGVYTRVSEYNVWIGKTLSLIYNS